MICQHCKKNEATIHLTQIVDGVIKKMNLCEECAKKLGLSKDLAYPLMETLQNMQKDVREKGGNEQVCPYCGYTLQDIEKKGRIGCPECYDVFSEKIEAVFKDVQRGDTHIGKQIEVSPKKKRKAFASKARAAKSRSDVVKIAKYTMDLSGPDAEVVNKAKNEADEEDSAKKLQLPSLAKVEDTLRKNEEALGALIVLACTLASEVEPSGNSAIDCEHLILSVSNGVEEYLNNPNKQFPALKNLKKVENDIPASLTRFGMDVMALVVSVCVHNHALMKAVRDENYEAAEEIRKQIETKKELIIFHLEKLKKK